MLELENTKLEISPSDLQQKIDFFLVFSSFLFRTLQHIFLFFVSEGSGKTAAYLLPIFSNIIEKGDFVKTKFVSWLTSDNND